MVKYLEIEFLSYHSSYIYDSVFGFGNIQSISSDKLNLVNDVVFKDTIKDQNINMYGSFWDNNNIMWDGLLKSWVDPYDGAITNQVFIDKKFAPYWMHWDDFDNDIVYVIKEVQGVVPEYHIGDYYLYLELAKMPRGENYFNSRLSERIDISDIIISDNYNNTYYSSENVYIYIFVKDLANSQRQYHFRYIGDKWYLDAISIDNKWTRFKNKIVSKNTYFIEPHTEFAISMNNQVPENVFLKIPVK